MKITIKQIAEMAGVHRSTVDKVLHNRGGVSQEVAAKIQKIIDEYDYKPNPIGQALKKQEKTIKIGVILLEVDARERITKGIREELKVYQSFDIHLEFYTVAYPDVKEQLRFLHMLIEQQVDGVILSPINSPEIVSAIDYCSSLKIPVVTVNTDIKGSSRFCFIGQDGERAGRVAGRLMGEFMDGKGRVAVFTSDGGEKQSFSYNQRDRGFREMLEVSYPKIHVLKSIRTDEDPKTIAAETRKLLAKEKRLSGILITCGGVKEVGRIVKELGREDLKIICYEDYPEILELLKEEIVDVTITSQLLIQGRRSLSSLLDYLIYDKKTPRKHLYTNIQILLKECIEEQSSEAPKGTFRNGKRSPRALASPDLDASLSQKEKMS